MNDLVRSSFSDEQVSLITRTIAPGLSQDELGLFLQACKRYSLDPFQKQIYALKMGGRMTVIVGIDGQRLIAERTGNYAPGRDTEFLLGEDGKLIGAKVYIKKWVKDSWHEMSATAFLSEYSKGSGLWSKMPSVMIEKAAEARALRRAFPNELSGVYAPEEMDQAEKAEVITVEEPKPMISEEMATNLEFLIGNSEEDIAYLNRVLSHYKATKLTEIALSNYQAIERSVKARKQKNEN
jgi:phage recombination protein Bet